MNALDVLIILLVVAVAARGMRIGLFRQAGSLGGFILGLTLGATLAPVAAGWFAGASLKSLVSIIVLFGMAIILSSVGELLGVKLARAALKAKLSGLDRAGGAVLGGLLALVASWLLGASLSRAAPVTIADELQGSRILRALDDALPPVPDVLSRAETLIAPNGFPRVFTGLEPTPAEPVTGPNAAEINQAVARAQASTVRIEGAGCGGVVEGSGFVAGSDLVMTNAHVVAGISRPFVVDGAGRHAASVVAFDPDLDVAVLRTTGLTGPVLPLASADARRGVVGAVLGYPGGSERIVVGGAAVRRLQAATGRNIYDRGIVTRDIYELQAVVRPGNSGGPFVSADGTVLGLVFAASTTNPEIGYALTAREIGPILARATSSGTVGSGACAAE